MSDNNNPYFYTNNNYENNEARIVLSNYQSLLCIAVGWLGLSVVATIISLIIQVTVDIPSLDSLQIGKLNGYVNFASYAVIFIALFCILGLPNIKKILAQFTDVNKLGKGIIYGGLLLGSSIAYNLVVLLIYPEFGTNQNQTEVVNYITSLPIISFFNVVILAPVTEEITYRLGLTGLLSKKSTMFAIIVSSTLFGLIHSAFLNFSFLEMDKQAIINEVIALPSYIISGVIMAIAYIKEDSIATSIVAHMTNNFIAFIQAFMPVEELIKLF